MVAISMLLQLAGVCHCSSCVFHYQGRSQGGFKEFGRTPFSELSFLNRDTG